MRAFDSETLRALRNLGHRYFWYYDTGKRTQDDVPILQVESCIEAHEAIAITLSHDPAPVVIDFHEDPRPIIEASQGVFGVLFIY